MAPQGRKQEFVPGRWPLRPPAHPARARTARTWTCQDRCRPKRLAATAAGDPGSENPDAAERTDPPRLWRRHARVHGAALSRSDGGRLRRAAQPHSFVSSAGRPAGVVGLGTPASAAAPTICGVPGTLPAAAVRAGGEPAERWRWTPGGRRHASSRRSRGAPRRANPLRTSRRLPRSRPLSAPAMAPSAGRRR